MAKMLTPATFLTAWLKRLPHPIPTLLGNSRRLAQHPTAVTTLGALFGAADPGDSVGPWWNVRAIRHLSSHLRPGDRVFEWGSGGSTVWLASRGAIVTSVEDNTQWLAKVKESCPDAEIRGIPGASTGTVVSTWGGAPDSSGPYYDEYVAAIDEFADDSFAVVIVDGQCRPECFRRAQPKVKPGGMLIVDDTDERSLEPLKRTLPGWKRVSVAGFKPTGDLRETTFFHRPARVG